MYNKRAKVCWTLRRDRQALHCVPKNVLKVWPTNFFSWIFFSFPAPYYQTFRRHLGQCASCVTPPPSPIHIPQVLRHLLYDLNQTILYLLCIYLFIYLLILTELIWDSLLCYPMSIFMYILLPFTPFLLSIPCQKNYQTETFQ